MKCLVPRCSLALMSSLGLLLATPGLAALISTQGGEQFEGEIRQIFEGSVEVAQSDGSTVQVALADLDGSSRSSVDNWGAENPARVDVYKNVDVKPKPVKTSKPDLDKSLRSINGMVAVEIVLDEKGRVIDASIYKTSDERLNEASLEAVNDWRFKPAEVGGKEVKCRLVIPLRFSGS